MKKQDKIQENLMKDLFSHLELTKPSASFEETVMYRVSVEKRYNPEIYQPVIGRTGWIAISIIIIAFIFLSVFLVNGESGYLDRILSFRSQFSYPDIELTGILKRIEEIFSSISSVVFYIIVGLLGMIIIMIADQQLRQRTLPKK